MERSFSLMFSSLASIFIVIFNLSVAITASTYIVSDLGGGLDISFYSFTLFAIGNVIGFPLGKLFIGKSLHRCFNKEEKEGKPVKLLLASLYFFLLFTLLCSLAPNYPVFLIFRFFQGFVSGPIIPLQQELCSAYLTEEKQGIIAKSSALIFTLGSVFSSSIGAWIAYESHWRWLFFLTIPLIIFLIFFIKKRHAYYDMPVKKQTFNQVGYISFALGILFLSLALTMGQDLDWGRSSCFLTLFAIGIIFFAFFLIWEMIHPDPLLKIKFLKQPGKILLSLVVMMVFSVYYGSNLLTAKWLHLDANYTPLWVAVILIFSVLAAILIFFVVDRFFSQHNPLILLFIALSFIGASCFYATQFDVTINFGRILFIKLLESTGSALFFFPILKLTLADIKEEMHDSLLTIFHIIRILFSGLGAALFSILLQRRQAFYHERLGSQITDLSPQTDQFFATVKEYHIEGSHATAEIAQALHRQSTTLALEDVFYLMGWLLVSLLLILIISWARKRLRKFSF